MTAIALPFCPHTTLSYLFEKKLVAPQATQNIYSIAKKVLAIFDETIEIRERCNGVHCVDLGESFPTSIYLQKSASIQPRTSPSKFGENNSKIQFTIHFTP